MTKRRIHIIATVAVVFFCLPVFAQVNNTLYFMSGIPQSNRFNPAFHPDGGFYLGFPLVSPARGGVAFNAQDYGDFIQPHPTEDSLITFLHPLADREAFLDGLKPVNYLSSNLGASLASFGFRTSVGYFSIQAATRLEGGLSYPGDLFHLLVNGTEEDRTYQLDGFGINESLFTEVSVGWSYELTGDLDIGVRLKALFGAADVSTMNSATTLHVSQESWHMQSDLQLNASLGFADVEYNEDDRIEDIVVDESLENPGPWEIARYALFAGNPGFGVDLGAVYRPLDELELSLSILDLAFIRWKDEVHQVSVDMDYEFRGLELNPFELGDDYSFEDYLDSSLTQIADSLSGFLDMGPGGAYTRRLNTKVYVGAKYILSPLINFGLISRTDFRKGIIAEHVTATANFTPGRYLDLTLSYSYLYGSFKNVGAGFSFNLGPMNLYLVSDNALNLVFWPEATRSINFWLGLNLMFGYRDKVDMPLIY